MPYQAVTYQVIPYQVVAYQVMAYQVVTHQVEVQLDNALSHCGSPGPLWPTRCGDFVTWAPGHGSYG